MKKKLALFAAKYVAIYQTNVLCYGDLTDHKQDINVKK